MNSFRLSVAELACAMACCGRAEAAFAYLQTVLGDSEPEQITIWFTAGGHALVARDLLQALPNDRFGELNSDLKQVVEVMLKDAKTLRCHRAGVVNDNSFERFSLCKRQRRSMAVYTRSS